MVKLHRVCSNFESLLYLGQQWFVQNQKMFINRKDRHGKYSLSLNLVYRLYVPSEERKQPDQDNFLDIDSVFEPRSS